MWNFYLGADKPPAQRPLRAPARPQSLKGKPLLLPPSCPLLTRPRQTSVHLGDGEFGTWQVQGGWMMTGPQSGRPGRVRLELHAALVSQRRLEMWGSRGAMRGGRGCWLADGENRYPQGPPLRTPLTVSLAARPFKDQMVLVTFKVLQSL